MGRKQIIATLKREQKAIAKARDNLREMLCEFEDVITDADDGIESIQIAIDALSRNQ